MAFFGGFLPERWDQPLAIGLGVVVTDLIGDTIKGFIGRFIPADWLDPAAEFVIGILLFVASRFVGGRFSAFVKVMSFGAFGIAIADTIGTALGIGSISPKIASPITQTRQSPKGVSFG